jgi:hypothetical protein
MPTPQTLVETIMFSVRDRGVAALEEPQSIERLSRCDRAARSQINDRIAKLLAAERIAGKVDA